MIPHQYYTIDVLNRYWALAFTVKPAAEIEYDFDDFPGDGTHVFWLADTVDIYALPEGRLLASIPREHIRHRECLAFGEYINITDRETGIVTTYDHDFNALGQPSSYVNQDFVPQSDNGFIRFQQEGLWGVKDKDENVIIPPEHDRIDEEVIGDCFTFSDDDRMGLADLNGNILVPAEFDEVIYPRYIRDNN